MWSEDVASRLLSQKVASVTLSRQRFSVTLGRFGSWWMSAKSGSGRLEARYDAWARMWWPHRHFIESNRLGVRNLDGCLLHLRYRYTRSRSTSDTHGT